MLKEVVHMGVYIAFETFLLTRSGRNSRVTNYPPIPTEGAWSQVRKTNLLAERAPATLREGEEVRMDEVDRKILEVLQRNARTSYKEIAQEVKISDVAVHKRIRRLEGVVRGFTVLLDQKAYGKEVTAILAVRCETGSTGAVAKELAALEDVAEVYTTVGEYDVVSKVRTRDTKSLKELVEKELSRIRGINEVRTSIVFECYKEKVNLVL